MKSRSAAAPEGPSQRVGGALAGLAGVSGAEAGRLLGAYHQAEL